MSVAAGVLAVAGALLTLVAAVGLIRLPDPVTRLHAVTKGSTLGTGLMLLAVVVALPHVDVAIKATVAFAAQLATAPVSAHLIGRTAHRTGLLGPLFVDEAAREPGASDAS